MPERARSSGLVPQRGPALLVEHILDSGPDFAVCRGRVPAASAFVTGGRAPAVLALELAAQAAAAQQALASDGPGEEPRPGYLVAIREAVLRADEVAAGEPLVATVRRSGGAGPLAVFDVSVTTEGGDPILTATLSTHSGA
jgi:predicted hotdog family 3-hydroxylacyl-ACP dehydratase